MKKIESKDELLDFLDNAFKKERRMVYTSRGEKEKPFYLFNDEYIDDNLKDLLFDNGFKVQRFYYRTMAEAFGKLYEHISMNKELDEFDIRQTVQADPYTAGLTQWLSEDDHRVYYVSEVLSEYDFNDGFEMLGMAQKRHKEEIYAMALDLIEKIDCRSPEKEDETNEQKCQVCEEYHNEENMEKVQLETFNGEWVCRSCLTDLEPQV